MVTGKGSVKNGYTGVNTVYTLDPSSGEMVNRGTMNRVCRGDGSYWRIGPTGKIARVLRWNKVLGMDEIQSVANSLTRCKKEITGGRRRLQDPTYPPFEELHENTALIHCKAYGEYFYRACAGNEGKCTRLPNDDEVKDMCYEIAHKPECRDDPNAPKSIDCTGIDDYAYPPIRGRRRLSRQCLNFDIRCEFDWFYLKCFITAFYEDCY